MEYVFVETKQATEFRESARIVSDMQKGQPGLFMCTGRPGYGKTEVAKRYARDNSEVLYVRVLEDWTAKAMLNVFSDALYGVKFNTIENAKSALLKGLDDNPVTIIVDEADRLSPSQIEHLRDMHDLTGSPFILIGEPALKARMFAAERAKSRITKIMEFSPVQPQDVMLFGLKAAGLKIEPAAAHKICSRTGGDWRYIFHDVRDLEKVAQANTTSVVTVGMVQVLPEREESKKNGRIKGVGK